MTVSRSALSALAVALAIDAVLKNAQDGWRTSIPKTKKVRASV